MNTSNYIKSNAEAYIKKNYCALKHKYGKMINDSKVHDELLENIRITISNAYHVDFAIEEINKIIKGD